MWVFAISCCTGLPLVCLLCAGCSKSAAHRYVLIQVWKGDVFCRLCQPTQLRSNALAVASDADTEVLRLQDEAAGQAAAWHSQAYSSELP